MDYKMLLEKYMFYILQREGSCYIDNCGPTAYYGEADHMSHEERKELRNVYEEMMMSKGL